LKLNPKKERVRDREGKGRKQSEQRVFGIPMEF